MPDNTNSTLDSANSQDGIASPKIQPIQKPPSQENDLSLSSTSPTHDNPISPPISASQKFSNKNPETIFTTQPAQKKGVNAKVVAAIVGIIFLALSVVSGVLLVQRQQRFTQKASENKNANTTKTYASCKSIKVYDTYWQPLSQDQLKLLETGDVIRFTIECGATSGNFDMARFIINDQTKETVTAKKEGTDELYYEYKIPQGVNTFKIKAEVYHSELGWF